MARIPVRSTEKISENTARILEKIKGTARSTIPQLEEGGRVCISGTKTMGNVLKVASSLAGHQTLVEYDYSDKVEWVPSANLTPVEGIVPANTPGFKHLAYDIYKDTRRGPDYGSIWKMEQVDGQDYLVVYTDEEDNIVRSVEASLRGEGQSWPRAGEGGAAYNDNIEPMGWTVEKQNNEKSVSEQEDMEDEAPAGGESGDPLTQAIEEALQDAGEIEPVGDGGVGEGVHLTPDKIKSINVEVATPGSPETEEFQLTPNLETPEADLEVNQEEEEQAMEPGGEGAKGLEDIEDLDIEF